MKSLLKYAIALSLLVGLGQTVHAQHIITESFDGSGLPTGWINSTYTSPSGGCVSTYGCAWYREPSHTGTPAPAAHSGAGYAFYDAYNISNGASAELTTPALDFSVYAAGYNQVSFWLYRDSIGTFYHDSITVYVNTTSGSAGATRLGSVNTSINLTPTVSTQGWYQYTYIIPASYSGSVNYIIFKAFSDHGTDVYLDDVQIDHYSPCSGVPSISGVAPAGPIAACPPATITLTGSLPLASGYTYQWQHSIDSGLTWSNIAGDTDSVAHVYVLSDAQFRLLVKCTNSSLTDSSSIVYVHTAIPVIYAKGLPLTEDFENWKSRCDSRDMPDTNWAVNPLHGDNSWRRDDQGVSDGGWSSSSGSYTPVAAHGSHSARFHSSVLSGLASGTMEMYVNCSTVSGPKQLRFSSINPSGNDSLAVYISVDSGATFKYMGRATNDYNWGIHYFDFTSNSPKTIVRFKAVSDSIGTTDDIGLDYVQVLPPCNSKPVAGTIDSVYPCSGYGFNLSLSGRSAVAALKYTWQQSSDSISWTSIASYDTTETALATIYSPTYFRVIVKCAVSGLSDTSAVRLVKIKPFYLCYCDPSAPGTSIPENIGNVTISALPSAKVILNNGIASPITGNTTAIHEYSDFDTLTPTILRLDSLYRLSVTEITQYSTLPTSILWIAAYIDYDHSETFDDNELVYLKSTVATTPPTYIDTFHIASSLVTIDTGITGMRVFITPVYTTTSVCNPNGGEYEDYLVNIKYPSCAGFATPGKIETVDSSSCIGYSFTLYDTTHQSKTSAITWSWQTSADSVHWTDISGTTDRDNLSQLFTARVYYRVRMVCTDLHDTTYTKVLFMNIKAPYKCYCLSEATGGSMDTSDIGGISISSFAFTKGGGHLSNGRAIYAREDLTKNLIDLYVDTTYTLDLYYVMRNNVNANAKVTLFIDYDNNYKYDASTELLWTDYTSSTYWYLSHDITIPELLVSDVPTGMRLIVNNNTNANPASDYGCGDYTSGETIDMVVRFNRAWKESVGSIADLQNLIMFPNPSNGDFKVQFNTSNTVKDLNITVSSMTGQQVYSQHFDNISGQFTTELDLNKQAKGIYFVEFIADGERMVRKMILK